MKKLLNLSMHFLGGLLLLLIFSIRTHAQFIDGNIDPILLLPDLKVSSLAITAHEGNEFSFKYKITNAGALGSVFLNRFYFQAYVSKDVVLDDADLPAGGSIFGNNAPALAIGESYTGTWHSEPDGSIDEYHYLIFDVKLRPGYSQPEMSTTNNRLAKDMRPVFSDLAVYSINVLSIDGNNKIKFNFQLINKGPSSINLEKFGFDTYVSENTTLQPGTDIPSGSSIFYEPNNSFTPSHYLDHGDTLQFTFTANPGPNVDLNKYVNLLLYVHLLPGKSEPQQNLVNDKMSKNLLNDFPDLVLSCDKVEINDDIVKINYSVSNDGQGLLFVEEFSIKTYISKNATLETASDILVSDTSITTYAHLRNGGVFKGVTAIPSTTQLNEYNYVICVATLLPSLVHPQIKNTNDLFVKKLGWVGPDMVLLSMPILNISGTTVSAQIKVRNDGNQKLDLSQYTYQLYYSEDCLLESPYVFLHEYDFPSIKVEAKGESPTFNLTFDGQVNLTDYHFIVLTVKLKPGEISREQYPGDLMCNNLQAYHPHSKLQAITFTQQDNSVQLTNSTDTPKMSDYILYSVNGEIVCKGSFVKDLQLPTSTLNPGLYILNINNDGKMESHKIMISQ